MKIYLVVTLFLFSWYTTSAQKAAFYVAPDGNDANPGTVEEPFKTIQKALDESIKKDAQFIYLKGGEYHLNEPLILKPGHSKKESSLRIENYATDKVVISGGQEITGWEKHENGWWVTEIQEVAAGDWRFRQIYVNGDLRHRARKPNEGFLRVAGMPEGTPGTVHYHKDCQSFEFAEGDIEPDWKNTEDVEVIVYHFWTDSHLPIQTIDTENNIVTFKHKAGKVFTDDFSENGARYIVENVFEELDAPGEWYLDRKTGKCYYYPFPNEKLSTTEIYAPVAPQLIRFDGLPEKQQIVKNIHFKNLEFRFTNFELPPGNSNDRQGSASVPAAVSLKGAENCSFARCRFVNLGTWAFELNEGCRNNSFNFNEIGHVAAGGFRINGGTHEEHPFLRTKNNQIKGNHIHHYGEVYPSAVGVLLQHTEGNHVANNLIEYGYYTGVSIGWEWGYQRSISRDNVVEFNHIHHIGQGLLSDMGAIYTLGVSPGTVIRNNLIHDVDANHYGGWGIYHDEGSTHILVENNVVYNTKFAAFNIHFCKEVTVRNNIFALGRLQQLSRSRREPHHSVYFEKNIIYWKEGELLDGNWTDEKSYEFYFHPKNETGIRQVTETFDMDYNLFYNPQKSVSEVDFNGKTWEEWQAAGNDVHSVFAAPLFYDAANYDFRLKENSPAFQLGFEPIDLSQTGLLKKWQTGPDVQ